MKKCPFCTKEIQDDVIKCSFCGKSLNSSKQEEEKFGFVLGNIFWIFFGFLGGSVAIIFGMLSVIIGFPISVLARIEYLLGGALAIVTAFGLLKRKKFGLYLIYVNLVLFGLMKGLLPVIKRTPGGFAGGILIIVIAFAWFRYFYKRKNWFK